MRIQCKCTKVTNVSNKPIAAEAGFVCGCGLEHRKVWGKWCTITEDVVLPKPLVIDEYANFDDKLRGALEAYIDNKLEELLKGKI